MKTLEKKLALITSKKATNFTLNNVLTYDFSSVIEDFFRENFDMYVTVEVIGNHQGHMRILSEHTFEFLKAFIVSVLGRHTVKIKLYTVNNNYVMELICDAIKDMGVEERTRFIRLAHKANFKLQVADGVFRLYTRYQGEDYLRVHVINVQRLELNKQIHTLFFDN